MSRWRTADAPGRACRSPDSGEIVRIFVRFRVAFAWRLSIADDLETNTVVLMTSMRFRKTRGEEFAIASGTCDSSVDSRRGFRCPCSSRGYRERRSVLISASTRGAMRV